MWLVLKDNFLLNMKRKENVFHFYLTNLIDIWQVETSSDDLIKKFNEFNPMFQMKDSAVLQKITDLYGQESNEDCHKVESESEGNLLVNSTNSIKGFTFKMVLVFQPSESKDMYNEFTTPLLQLLSNFKEREKELVSIIEAKDVELEEYRLEGVEIKRRGVITAPFSFETFSKTKCKTPLVEHPIGILKGPLQKLLSSSEVDVETEHEENVVADIPKQGQRQPRVVADVKSISGTAGCLYSAKTNEAKCENNRKRKIPTRTLKL